MTLQQYSLIVTRDGNNSNEEIVCVNSNVYGFNIPNHQQFQHVVMFTDLLSKIDGILIKIIIFLICSHGVTASSNSPKLEFSSIFLRESVLEITESANFINNSLTSYIISSELLGLLMFLSEH